MCPYFVVSSFVGIIDLMNKGLRLLKSSTVIVLDIVGIIDLMNKGLRRLIILMTYPF